VEDGSITSQEFDVNPNAVRVFDVGLFELQVAGSSEIFYVDKDKFQPDVRGYVNIVGRRAWIPMDFLQIA